jgi:hypothetical protein
MLTFLAACLVRVGHRRFKHRLSRPWHRLW